MITLKQIARMVESGSFTQLIDRLDSCGDLEGLTGTSCRNDNAACKAIALGLALQKVCEFSYGRCRLADEIAEQLIAALTELAEFDPADAGGCDDECGAAARAVALRGLFNHARLNRTAIENDPLFERELQRLIDACVSAIEGAQDHKIIAIALWQLGDVHAFRTRAPVDRMIEQISRAEGGNLPRLAMAMAA